VYLRWYDKWVAADQSWESTRLRISVHLAMRHSVTRTMGALPVCGEPRAVDPVVERGRGRPNTDELTPHDNSGQSPATRYVSERLQHEQRGVRDLDDPQLAAALAGRDEVALAELYQRYGLIAYTTAVRILHDPAIAEDVVQDAFLKLWNNAPHFAASRGSLRTWLTTAVRNRAIDRLRGRSAHEREECELTPGLNVTEPMSDPSSRVSVSVERTAVREALDSLPRQQRLAVELAYFGSYTQPEIASMTGVALGTVKGRIRLGLHKLSLRLQGRGLLDG
jgi:RNA polymerase sigma-70 factor (ECF subfamily)